MRGGLTRGLTPAVSWFRAVVLRDPHVFVDTWFRPMLQFGTPSQGARIKTVWVTAPLEQPRDRSLWVLLLRIAVLRDGVASVRYVGEQPLQPDPLRDTLFWFLGQSPTTPARYGGP